MAFLQRINLVWQNVGLVQKAMLLAIVLTFVIAGGLLTHWASKPDMRLLYQDLSLEDAGKVADKLSSKKIEYEIRGETAIYVPAEHVRQARLDMAKEGLPAGGQNGYRIFDNSKIGVDPFVQGVNLQRALQEELAKTIQMIEGVTFARIHIVSAEKSIFSSQQQDTSASVALVLRTGYTLSKVNIGAITQLVAGAVEGLKADDVTIVDNRGRLLSHKAGDGLGSSASTVQDYRERIEQSYASRVEEMLTAVLGPGRAKVTVSAVVDMNSVSVVKEVYDPTGKVTTKEEITSGSEIGASSVSADAGARIPGSTKKDETIVTEYKVGKTVEQKQQLPGRITSLKVAAFVDLSPSGADANDTSAAPVMTVESVEGIIKNALGLEDTSDLKVIDVKFNKPEPMFADEPQEGINYVAIASNASLGIMAICALLILKIFSGGKKNAAEQVSGGIALPGGENAQGLLPAGSMGNESALLRRQIATALQEHPEQAKQLFVSWIGGKV